MTTDRSLLPVERIEQAILLVRGQTVMLDRDLAHRYRVESRSLVQAVERNAVPFLEDFMFQLTPAECDSLRSQIVISNAGRGGRRYIPYVFTEQGVAKGVTGEQNGYLLNDPANECTCRFRSTCGW